MICGIFHKGSGLGNQLHRYVMTRVVAEDKGYDWGMLHPSNFKGNFIDLDMGKKVRDIKNVFIEKRVNNENGVDVRGYDWSIFDIKDRTEIDGEFQGEEYFEHRLDEIREWLKVKPLRMSDDLCVINFRGGEYSYYPDLYLTKEYWDFAIEKMKNINPKMRFQVHTDDPFEAHKFLPEFPIIQDISVNWRAVRYAKYLILSNSSFAILPALLGEAKMIYAPKNWARRNTGVQALAYNVYTRFEHI